MKSRHPRGPTTTPSTRDLVDPSTMATLLDHAYDAVTVRSVSGEILYWNSGAERLYGWGAEDAVGQVAHSLLRTRFPKPLVVIEETLREAGRWEGRLLHTHRDGRTVIVDARWALDPSRGEGIVLEINRDITGRLDAEEAARTRERQLQFITDGAPVLIAHCDRDHRFKFVNRAYAARFAMQPSELVGRSIADVLGRAAYETISPFVTRALQGEHVDVEVEVPYETLGRQFMRFAYNPEFDETGAVVGYVAAIINVTDRHRAEEALREANERKDAFLATLAHELRNPLAAMNNATHLMSVVDRDTRTRERAVAIIERQLRQLVRLVDDLLDVSRITRGQLQLRVGRVELAEVIRTAVESTALAIGTASQTLRLVLPDDPILLDADAERLSQVFTNLLMNATKYTPAGGDITVTAAAAGDGVTVTIQDSGVGIPPEMLESVFDMFTRVHSSRDDAFGGLGIGLTLVRSMVELHGGTVTAESKGVNQGSTFTVRLPRVQQLAAQPAERTAAPAKGVVMKRVLIADDNLDAAESLQLWLEMAGHQVQIATNGVVALSVAESFKPDVALLDIGMPGMTGFDVAKKIREAPWGENIVLVALTGWGQEEDRRQTADAGFDHHLTKPVPPDAIEALIRDA